MPSRRRTAGIRRAPVLPPIFPPPLRGSGARRWRSAPPTHWRFLRTERGCARCRSRSSPTSLRRAGSEVWNWLPKRGRGRRFCLPAGRQNAPRMPRRSRGRSTAFCAGRRGNRSGGETMRRQDRGFRRPRQNRRFCGCCGLPSPNSVSSR